MKLNSSNPILFLALSLSLLLCSSITAAAAAAPCNQTCGGRTLPFPFGFSSGCQIQLNCSSNNTVVLAADFPVLSITGDTIVVNLPSVCGRPVEALRRLFTENYAPNLFNAILLQNCSGRRSPCFIPTTTVWANFELLDCGQKSDNISCYSEPDNTTLFMDYGKLRRSGCRSLFSAISVESLDMNVSVSLEVRILRLGWWILGNCSCSDHAECDRVWPPLDGKPMGYRCRCVDGFVGDGFSGGVGCRKESQRCNLSKYISGQCRGATRILVLVGGAAAAIILTAAMAVALCFIKRRSKSRSRSRSQRIRKLTAATDITIPIYPYKEMQRATNFFSDKKMLGTGAYGTVYSGKLPNDKYVAVKRLRQTHSDDSSTIEHVINEIKLISSVSHPNLVHLLGCSIETEHILVYEFMPNGTLCQHLQRQKGDGLAWPVRLNIAVETARALAYLHNALHPPIYHRDVKSSNILLDYNYGSKVADFGLSRLGMSEQSHVSTAPQGTPGYVDPQYDQHFQLSDKSDVYSFGVVLVEIITAMRVVDFGRAASEINLAALAVDRIGRGCLQEIIDPFILNSTTKSKEFTDGNVDDPTLLSVHKVAEFTDGKVDDPTLSSVHKVAELAFRCLAFDRELRPTMMEVAVELEEIATSKWKDLGLCSADLATKSEDPTVENGEGSGVSKVSRMNLMDNVKRDFSLAASADDSMQSDESLQSTNNSLINKATL